MGERKRRMRDREEMRDRRRRGRRDREEMGGVTWWREEEGMKGKIER